MQDNDPLVVAEHLLQVKFEDNDIEPLNKLTQREKAVVIGKHAKDKLHQGADEEHEIEIAVELD